MCGPGCRRWSRETRRRDSPAFIGSDVFVSWRRSTNMRVVRAGLLMAGVLLLLAGSARAQAIGQIFGKATDATGAVLPGVNVPVSGPGLQRPQTAVTTATGAYTFPNVPIGTYTVTIELSGFKKATRPDIT